MHALDKQLHHMVRGEFDTAWQLSQEMEALGPDEILDSKGNKHTDIWLRHQFNRGWFLLQQGHYQSGSVMLEAGRHLGVYGGGVLKTNAPIFDPSKHKIQDASFILSLEGGYGDEIIHARFAQSLKNKGARSVYIACAPELLTVLARVPGVDGTIMRDQTHTVKHDFWIPGFSAGWLCGHTYDDLPNDPYIVPLEQSVTAWSSLIKSDKKKIGIRWSGNPKFEHHQYRRFPREYLTNLSQHSEIQLYSLQRDTDVGELPPNIVDLQHMLLSWEDTIGAIANLDLVITSCTSIAHISAALGKETWVIVPIMPYHIWALNAPHSNTSPYYKNVTLFRQDHPTSWGGAFDALYMQLVTKFSLSPIQRANYEITPTCLVSGTPMVPPGSIDVDPTTLASLRLQWSDNTFTNIQLHNVLQRLPVARHDLTQLVHELIRVSSHQATWEITVPYHFNDANIGDLSYIHAISPASFASFPELTVDTVRVEFVDFWDQKLKSGEIDLPALQHLAETTINVMKSINITITVNKR